MNELKQTETVKRKIEFPENVLKAIDMFCAKFDKDFDNFIVESMRETLHSYIGENFESVPDYTSFTHQIEDLIKPLDEKEFTEIVATIPSNIVSAIFRIAKKFNIDTNDLTVRLIRYALEVETDQLFSTFIDEIAEKYLEEQGLYGDSLIAFQSEIKELI